MSYARFSEGDVYVFYNTREQYECCACTLLSSDVSWVEDEDAPFGGYLTGIGHFETPSVQEMIDHLREHEKAGHYVPCRAFEGLEEELNSE